ncbi:MAG: phosphatase [Butyricicoccaceae bacterium]
MNYAVVDLGSNTIRLSVYKDTDDGGFRLLFSQKETAGLAGYVQAGALSPEGIDLACAVLQEFRAITVQFGIEEMHVLATASLRNISNTREAAEAIRERTGTAPDILSGRAEAELGYYGAVHRVDFSNGIFFDIGGGSTETAIVSGGEVRRAGSIPIGSLNLFERFVSEIWPSAQELEAMTEYLYTALSQADLPPVPTPRVCGIGGTARALLKISNSYFGKPASCCTISLEELLRLHNTLTGKEPATRKLILRKCPDRVHTIIPGTVLMTALARRICQNEILISPYGVREGYLCKKLMKSPI